MARFHLLLDLDGTLTDSKPGIVASLRHTLQRLGRPFPEHASLDACIGPPLQDVLAHLLDGASDAELSAAVEHYRAHHESEGLYRARVYDGIGECLTALGAGATLHVVTSKLERTALTMLGHVGLLGCFGSVSGAQPDGRLSDKGALIGTVLARERLAPRDVAMIGDRRFDIQGARANAISGYGVTWGYGSERELLDAGATALFRTPQELAAYFLNR